MNGHLFFCGIKHSGKSTLGRLYARHQNLKWVDLDDLIRGTLPSGMSIRDFYRLQGKEAFQAKETSALNTLLRETDVPLVVSLGGGASDNPDLLSIAKANGKLVYLQVAEQILLNRILRGGVPPFLDPDDIEGSFHALYDRRHKVYGKVCDILIQLPNYTDVRDTAAYLIKALKSEV